MAYNSTYFHLFWVGRRRFFIYICCGGGSSSDTSSHSICGTDDRYHPDDSITLLMMVITCIPRNSPRPVFTVFLFLCVEGGYFSSSIVAAEVLLRISLSSSSNVRYVPMLPTLSQLVPPSILPVPPMPSFASIWGAFFLFILFSCM